MTTTEITSEWVEVSLSRKHDGQIVTPIVERRIVRARKSGETTYAVRLSFHDSSDQTTSAPEEHTGAYWDCIRWLQSHGILTDDSNF